MAVHWPAGFGNNSAVFGGQWNTQLATPVVWANPLSSLTALTVALTVKPTTVPVTTQNPADGVGDRMFQQESTTAFDTTFALSHNGNGVIRFRVVDFEGVYQSRVAASPAGSLLAGQWNRIVARWQASGAMSIWNNGVDLGATVTGTVIPRLTPQHPTYGMAPIEVGAESKSDLLGVPGDYAEAALWGAVLSDADALHYGQGWSPNILTNSARIRYVRFLTSGVGWVDQFGNTVGSCIDEWSGHQYGAGEVHDINNPSAPPYGGVFDAATFSTVAHPSVRTSALLFEDADSLPIRGFEPHELADPGPRTGVVLTASTQAALAAALVSAQYGDDIVIPAGSVITSTFSPPSKSVTAATLRRPPSGRTPLTGGTALTG